MTSFVSLCFNIISAPFVWLNSLDGTSIFGVRITALDFVIYITILAIIINGIVHTARA